MDIYWKHGVTNMETRFFYHPVTKEFLNCGESDHALYFHNKGYKAKRFDNYIRGIVSNKVLYLRIFYPLDDISERTLQEVKDYSFDILFKERNPILKVLKIAGVKAKKVCYNVSNDDLKGVIVNI